MEQKEALFWLKTMSEETEVTQDCLENDLRIKAIDMAITALKKRLAYLRLIEKYQTRQKFQAEELTRLNSYRQPMKAEIYTDTISGLDLEGKSYSYEQNFALCPRCGDTVGVLEGEGGYHGKYCESCGQHVEWYEVENEQMD